MEENKNILPEENTDMDIEKNDKSVAMNLPDLPDGIDIEGNADLLTLLQEDDDQVKITEHDLEEEAVADPISSLLFDAEEDDAGEEDEIDFESFMTEYRNLMTKNRAAANAAEAEEPEKELTEEEKRRDYEDEYLVRSPKKTAKAQKAQKKKPDTEEVTQETHHNPDWHEDITLSPEEYAPLDDDEIHVDDQLAVESEPDFDLGDSLGEDGFQISMSFDKNGDAQQPQGDEDEPQPEKYDPDKPRAIDWAYDIAEIFVVVLTAVILLTGFVFKHSEVEGGSMNNTLSDGDHLIISDLFYTPERGDIIVFEDYSTILKKAVVKRIVGLPGETVEVKMSEDGVVEVYINGQLLQEDYALNTKDSSIYTTHVGPITLGDDEVFVMGDNRYNSTDSRHEGVGPIKIDTILGKVLFRFFPFDSFGGVD